MEEKINGTDTLLNEGSSITVENKVYTMRRLGIRDVYSTVNLLKKAIAYGCHDLRFLENITEVLTAQKKEGLITVAALLCGLTDIEEPFLSLIASVLLKEDGTKVTIEDIYDPNIFPADSMFKIVLGFLQHQDIVSFFTSLTAMTQHVIPQLKVQILQDQSSTP